MFKITGRRLRKILLGVTLFFAFYTLAGFFLVPYALKSILVSKLSEYLHREAAIKEVGFNPYSFAVTIRGFTLKDKKGPAYFVSFDELYLNLQARSLIRKAVVIKEVRLRKPSINIVRNEDGTYNFSDLLPKKAIKGATHAKGALKFSINNIQISGGRVDFDDRLKNIKHRVTDIDAAIPFISNLPREADIFVKPSFSAKVNGAGFKLEGETKPFADTLETLLSVRLNNLSIPYYLSYSPVALNFKLVSGYLSADIAVSYRQYANREPSLTFRGPVDLKKIDLEDHRGDPVLALPSLHADISSAEVFSRTVYISSIVLQRLRVHLKRDKNGDLNLKTLLPESKGAAKDESKKTAGQPLAVNIDKINLQRAGFYFSDFSEHRNFHRVVEPIDCTISGFSSSGNKPAGLSLRVKNTEGESGSADGNFTINPVAADLKIGLEGIDVASFDPYIGGVANISVTKGRASAFGRLRTSLGGKDEYTASFAGNARLTGFSARDKSTNEVILKWKSLGFGKMDIGYNPILVRIGRISLTDFFSDVVVNHDGVLNLKEIITKKESGAPAAKSVSPTLRGAGPRITVNTIILKGGRLNFNDRHIEPNFLLQATEVGARVSGISSLESKAADVDLTAKIDGFAPLEITGKINPLRKDLFADLHVSLNDFDMSTTTPYTGRYLGYSVEKGKLYLNLLYRINQRKLNARNDILLDQFDFGDRVESQVALKLPIKFAVNMLKDRDGKIDIDFPLSGTLDDPQFSIGGIIIKIIVNLIVKAATSPFALLGQIFGGGADLGYVEFNPGSHALTVESMKKLDSLINALYNRPALKLDVEGYVDIGADRASLRDYMFTRSIKAQKYDELTGKEKAATTIDEVTIGPKEYEKYLWLAYKNGKFRKPTNFIGLTKKLPVPEMEKLLRENTIVTDDDLRALASDRAMTVKDYILASKKVDPRRVFIVWPKSLSPEKKDNLKDSRVEFNLE